MTDELADDRAYLGPAQGIALGMNGELRQLRRLETVSMIEATTLVTLVGVAVPLKHVWGSPLLAHLMGPLHGIAFLFYVWTVLQTVSGGGWTRRETARLLVAAFVPFGGYLNVPWLRRREARHLAR